MKTTSQHTTATHHGDIGLLTRWLALILFLSPSSANHAQSPNSELVDMKSELQRVSEKIQSADRDAHSQVWHKVGIFRDARGNSEARTNVAFVQLETGMHYWQDGEWRASRAVIEPFDGGAIARHGPHKVIFADNLNTAGAIDLETSDAKRLRSHVLGLAYVDSASGKAVFIAELKDCRGEIVNTNQVVYPDAFKGVKADVRYTYTKAGLEQDIILRAQPPSPTNYGLKPETTRLQAITEFLSPPQPIIQQITFRDARGEDATDELLDFGDMKVGAGRAFPLDEETHAGAPVSKQWLKTGGRNFLVEEVALPDIAAGLEALPRSASISRPNKAVRTAKLYQQLPRAQKSPNKDAKMLVAKLESPEPGLVLDYVMLNGNLQDYTFKGDTTYYISGNVILFRTTTIEGGAVVKYAPGKSVQLSSSVVCKTGPYRPAIFTARDDDTVGEVLTGISDGTPLASEYASTALAAPTSAMPSLSYLRISHAAQGLSFNSVGGPNLTVRNMQFVNCQVGIATYYCSMGIKVRNALFKSVGTVLSTQGGYSAGTPDAQHITVDGSTWLWATSHPYGQGTFKNCVFANLSGLINQSGAATVGGQNNGFYNAPSFGTSPTVFNPPDPSPFETVGAGTCYLNPSSSSGSAFISVGTPTIDTALAADLTRKTTTAPRNITEDQTIPTDSNWSQTVLRDTDTPDLGYHYDPLDVCASRVTLGGTLTVNSDTAIGYFGPYGFRNGMLTIQGTPLHRSTVAHYSAVQEQPFAWGANACATSLLDNGSMPALRWRFVDVNTASGVSFGGGSATSMDIAHCSLLAPRMTCDGGYYATLGFTNNIIERGDLVLLSCNGGPYYANFYLY